MRKKRTQKRKAESFSGSAAGATLPSTFQLRSDVSMLIMLLGIVFSSQLFAAELPPISRLKLPAGFKVEVFSASVPKARGLAISPEGTLYVGSRGENVYALPDRNRDGKPDRVILLGAGLENPLGVAFRNGALYASSVNRIFRWEGVEKT